MSEPSADSAWLRSAPTSAVATCRTSRYARGHHGDHRSGGTPGRWFCARYRATHRGSRAFEPIPVTWVASASCSGPAVPVVVVGAYAEYLRQRPQRREYEVLYPDGRRGDPALVAEVPEGGAELERVPRRAPGRGLAVGHQVASAWCHSLACNAGRSSTMPSISPGPGFPSECGTPAGTTMIWPARAMRCSPPMVKWASPAKMVNRSSWRGWM